MGWVDHHLPRGKLAADAFARSDGTLPSGVRTQFSMARDHVHNRCSDLGLSSVDRMMEKAQATAEHLVGLCESPIEMMLLPWLIVENYGDRFETFPAKGFNHKTDNGVPAGDIVVAPQFAFVRYRADFAVLARQPTKTAIFIVECDGAEFHTAVKDNPRDACFESWGVKVIRAMGSEIKSAPRSVSARVSSAIQEWAEK